MPRHYVIAISFVVVTGCVATGLPSLNPPEPGLTPANFERIRDGMTKADVDAILGSTGECQSLTSTLINVWTTVEWSDGVFKATVQFHNDQVCDKKWAVEEPHK
ncbi:MAG TPA: hypothetical protein VFE62_08720 [Gemmataceae bacterium]|nr:hypothetical protein [Gemmataceae bacterium]